MTHQEKLAVMLSDLGARGVKKGEMMPLLHRFLWRIGLPITPPHFTGFGINVLLMGTWFATFMLFVGLIMFRHHSFRENVVGAFWAGLIFGTMWAAYYRWQSWKLSLPRWKDYPKKET